MGAPTIGFVFSFFFKRTADVLAPCLSIVFRQLVRLGTNKPMLVRLGISGSLLPEAMN